MKPTGSRNWHHERNLILALCHTNACSYPLSKKADYLWSAPLGGKMPILASQRGHVRRSELSDVIDVSLLGLRRVVADPEVVGHPFA